MISEPPPDGATRFIRDNGFGPLISRWDHWIAIATGEDGTTRYVDRVDIEAGALTGLVAAFARVFYAHRQRRWRALARTGFAALKAWAAVSRARPGARSGGFRVHRPRRRP